MHREAAPAERSTVIFHWKVTVLLCESHVVSCQSKMCLNETPDRDISERLVLSRLQLFLRARVSPRDIQVTT
jgi:hypothetical protein